VTQDQLTALLDRLDRLVTMQAVLVSELSKTAAALNALADAIAAPVEVQDEVKIPAPETDFDGNPIG
jgi:hypothetical protein